MDDKFQNYLLQRGRSGRTLANYQDCLGDFARWFEQENGRPLAPCDVTPTDVRAYRASMVSRQLAPATINQRLAALRAYAACYEIELGHVRGLAEQPAAPHWLDKSQQAKLMREIEREINLARTPAAAIQAVRNKAIVMLLIGAGLRISELCELEIGDLEISERAGRVTVRHGKGEKQRIIPLNADVRAALRSWINLRPEGYKAFSGQQLEPLCDGGVRRLLAEYARRAGMEVTPHRLRHSFAKNLIDAGVSIDHVKMLLGHKDLRATLRYTLPDERDLAKDVSKLEM